MIEKYRTIIWTLIIGAFLTIYLSNAIYWHLHPTGNPPGSIVCGDGSQPHDGACD